MLEQERAEQTRHDADDSGADENDEELADGLWVCVCVCVCVCWGGGHLHVASASALRVEIC